MFTILSTCKGGGYMYCRTEPPHPKRNSKGLYPLHRVLVENKIKRFLQPEEEIHHKDGNKENNIIDNLEIMSKTSHAKYHAEKRIPELEEFEYPQCHNVFLLKPHIARLRKSRNKNNDIFCSRSCASTTTNTRRLASSLDTSWV